MVEYSPVDVILNGAWLDLKPGGVKNPQNDRLNVTINVSHRLAHQGFLTSFGMKSCLIIQVIVDGHGKA